MHRLDRLNANIPANLFDSKLLTQEAPGQTDWPVYCSFGSITAGLVVGRAVIARNRLGEPVGRHLRNGTSGRRAGIQQFPGGA